MAHWGMFGALGRPDPACTFPPVCSRFLLSLCHHGIHTCSQPVLVFPKWPSVWWQQPWRHPLPSCPPCPPSVRAGGQTCWAGALVTGWPSPALPPPRLTLQSDWSLGPSASSHNEPTCPAVLLSCAFRAPGLLPTGSHTVSLCTASFGLCLGTVAPGECQARVLGLLPCDLPTPLSHVTVLY